MKDKVKKSTIAPRGFRTIVYSRHPTHNILRTQLERLPFRSLVRLGSTTELSERARTKGSYVECNPIEGIKNTSNKITMKMKFIEAKVPSPTLYLPYVKPTGVNSEEKIKVDKMGKENYLITAHGMSGDVVTGESIRITDLQFPLVAKINFHSRGRGMLFLKDVEALQNLLKQDNARKYTFEKYTNFAREYRVHATQNGIFYICRKLRKTDAEERWFFNSKNSIFEITFEDGVWIKKELPCFKRMQEECIKSLKALQMDIAGFDIRVNMTGEEFLIIEANSACSFGEHTAQHYIKQITKVLKEKHDKNAK